MPDLTRSVVHLLVTAASVFVVAKVLPGMKVKSFGAALAFAFVVALLNVFAWTFLAPFTQTFKLLTLGFGGFVINGIIFVVAGHLVGGVKISGCFMAAVAAAAVTFMNHVIHHLLRGVSW